MLIAKATSKQIRVHKFWDSKREDTYFKMTFFFFYRDSMILKQCTLKVNSNFKMEIFSPHTYTWLKYLNFLGLEFDLFRLSGQQVTNIFEFLNYLVVAVATVREHENSFFAPKNIWFFYSFFLPWRDEGYWLKL